MVRRCTVLAATLFSAGCSDNSAFTHLPTGRDGRPIRTPCDASYLLLHFDLSLSCERGFPLEPTTGDPRYWRGEMPCKKTIEYLSGNRPTEEVTFDYSKSWEFPGATYDGAGNMTQWNASALFPPHEVFAHYEYDDRLLVRARLQPFELASFGEITIVHEEGRRIRESGVNGKYHYVYDSGGRLIAEGLPVDGAPPVRYPREMLEPDADGELPRVREHDPRRDDFAGASVALFTYFYNSDDRLQTVGAAPGPGLSFVRYDYEYDDDRLISVTSYNPGAIDPALGSQRWSYHDCNGH